MASTSNSPPSPPASTWSRSSSSPPTTPLRTPGPHPSRLHRQAIRRHPVVGSALLSLWVCATDHSSPALPTQAQDCRSIACRRIGVLPRRRGRGDAAELLSGRLRRGRVLDLDGQVKLGAVLRSSVL